MSNACPIVDKSICSALNISNNAYRMAARRLLDKDMDITKENIEAELMNPETIIGKNSDFSAVVRNFGNVIKASSNQNLATMLNLKLQSFPKTYYKTFTDKDGYLVIVLNNLINENDSFENDNGTLTTNNPSAIVTSNGETPYVNSDYLNIKYSIKESRGDSVVYGGNRNLNDDMCKSLAREIYKLKKQGIVCNVSLEKVDTKSGEIKVSKDDGAYNVQILLPTPDITVNTVQGLKKVVSNIQSDVEADAKERKKKIEKDEKDAVRLDKETKSFGGIGVSELDKSIFSIIDFLMAANKIKTTNQEIASILIGKVEEMCKPREGTPAMEYMNHVKSNRERYAVKYLIHKGVKVTQKQILELTSSIDEAKEIYDEYKDIIDEESTEQDEQQTSIDSEEEDDNNNDEDGNANSIWKKDYFTAKEEDLADDEVLYKQFAFIVKNNLLDTFATFYSVQEVVAELKNVLADSESLDESYERLKNKAETSTIVKNVLKKIDGIKDQNIKNKFLTRIHSKFALRDTSFIEYSELMGDKRAFYQGSSNTPGTNKLNAALFGLFNSKGKKEEVKKKILELLNNVGAKVQDEYRITNKYSNEQLKSDIDSFINEVLGLSDVSNGVDIAQVRSNLQASRIKDLSERLLKDTIEAKDIFAIRDALFSTAVQQADSNGKITVSCAGKLVNRYLAPSFLQNMFSKKISKMSQKGFVDFVKSKFKPGFFYTESNGGIVFYNPLLRNLFDNNTARGSFDFAYVMSSRANYMENLSSEELKRCDIEMYFRAGNPANGETYIPLPMQSLKKSWNYIKVPVYTKDVLNSCIADISGLVQREAQLKGIAKRHGLVKNGSLKLFGTEILEKDSANKELVDRYNEILGIAEERELTALEQDDLNKIIECELTLRGQEFIKGTENYPIKRGADKYLDAFYNMQTNMISAYSLLATSPMFFKSEEDSFKRLAGAHSLGTQMASGTKMRYVVLEDIKDIVSEMSETLKGVGLDKVDFTDGQGYESSIARKEKLDGCGLSEAHSAFVDNGTQMIPRKPLIYTVSDTDVTDGAFGINSVPVPIMMKFAESVLPTTESESNSFGGKLNALLKNIKEKTGVTVHGVTFTSSTKGTSYNVIKTKDLVQKLNAKELTYDQFCDELYQRIENSLMDADGRFLETGCMSFDSSGFQYVATTHDNFTNSTLNVSSQFQAAFSVDDEHGNDVNKYGHSLMPKQSLPKTTKGVAAQAVKNHNDLLAENCIARPEEVAMATMYHIEDKVRALFSYVKRSIKFKAKGGHLYQVCSLLTNELKVVHTGDKMDYVEVEIPLPSSNGIEKYINKDGSINTELALSEHPDWGHFIAYRTPTEGLQSIIPCKVKRFLPITHAGEIRLPKEITFFTGSDFDGDSYNIIFRDDKYGSLYDTMRGILTKKGSLYNYAISGFANEAKIIHDYFTASADAITPISLNRRYSSYDAVSVASSAVGIFAKQKSLHLLSLRSSFIPKVNLSKCMIEGKQVQKLDAVAKVSRFDGYITSNRLGALVGASVDILTDNIFFPINLNLDNINMFITAIRAGISFKLSCAICKSRTMNNIMTNPKLMEKPQNVLKEYMNQNNIDDFSDVDITLELLMKENPTVKEKLAMLNFYCNLRSLMSVQAKLDKPNKGYSLNSKKADEWSGMALAVDIHSVSKIPWIQEQQNRYLDVLENVFGTFAQQIIGGKVKIKDPRVIKNLFNLYTVYKAYECGFLNNDELDGLVERQAELYDECPDYMKKFLELRQRNNSADNLPELTRTNLSKAQESDFENAYEMLYQENPKLALDLFKLSLGKYGLQYNNRGFCHLAPLNLMQASTIQIGDERFVGPNMILSSLSVDYDTFMQNAKMNGIFNQKERINKNRFVIATDMSKIREAYSKYSVSESEDGDEFETEDYDDDVDVFDVDGESDEFFDASSIRSDKNNVSQETSTTLASVSAELGIKLDGEDFDLLQGVCGV